MLKKFLFLATVLSTIFLSNSANAANSFKFTNKVKASVIMSKDNLSLGENFSILIKLEMKNGWHTYWKNPGETGEATKISWNLQGYKATLINQSFPITFITDNVYQYGYDDVAYYHYKIENNSPNDNFVRNVLYYEVEISYLACKDECVPESLIIPISINLNKLDNLETNNWHQELEKAKATFPNEKELKTHYIINGEILTIDIESQHNLDNAKEIKFIAFQEGSIKEYAKQSFEYDKNGNIKISIPLYSSDISEISGLVYIDNHVFEINPGKDENITEVKQIYQNNDKSYHSFITILFMAFVGGLILNLMPCILPIITIKAIALAQSSHNRKESRIEAIMYFLGVVLSFLIIATILMILRIHGEKIGWGFQLQSSAFVIFMIIMFAVIFLILIDVITIKNPFNKVGRISFEKKRINSFVTGLFSVLIASPCSAPFMGVAVGYTLSKPLYIYYPVFLALSIGYALPFTLIGFFPDTIHKFIPKPGKWMITLKKILSIPILLTCIWLSWVLYSQVNVTKLEDLNWQEYDETAVIMEIENNNPVFIDFTAKWCITCLVNKKTVLESNYFNEIVSKNNIKLFRADWTEKNDEITKALEKYERNSVPLYVYYKTNSSEYEILPQILTKSIIEKNLQ